MNEELYFSPAELAKLTGISKQLLLYYDKNDIFSPTYVNTNGYRYYKLSQYFSLQIIVSLRKLGLSLKEIQTYTKNKDISSLQKIYQHKLKEYQDKITALQNLEKIIKQKLLAFEQIKDLPLNQILLEIQESESLYISEPISFSQPIKQRMKILASHMLPIFSCATFHDYLMGFLYDSKMFLSETKLTNYHVFIKENTELNYNKAKHHKKEKGLYLVLYGHANYGVINKELSQKIINFIKLNSLIPLSPVYIFPLRNFWSTSNQKEEIVKICLRVKYKDGI